jgi:hypothetical protein
MGPDETRHHGEVGIGVLLVFPGGFSTARPWCARISGPSGLSLALNLALTGVFILCMSKLLKPARTVS